MTTEVRPVRYRVELFGLLTAGAAEAIKVRVLDLSETGAFLERPELADDLQEGDPVTLALSLPGIGMWTTGARVSRMGTSRLELKRPGAAHVTVTREGNGIEFVELGDEGLEQLRDFLELLDQR
ncbi:MAG: hypothetical protein H6Q89_2597 [Myxococcaceae bacterium]|nr:hypothetical protein [Myxococcaceae bacterium]